MKNIVLDHQEQNNAIILSGSFESIIENRRAMLFLKEYLQYLVIDEGIKIQITESVYKTIDLIKKVVAYTTCEIKYSDELSLELNQYLNQESQFVEYSLKALNIRNNNCEASDFNSFCNAVSKVLSERTLYPLQLLSAYHLAFSQNACNFSVPGAGKTSIVYGAFAYLSSLPKSDIKNIERVVIVGPLSSFGPWESEFFECFGRKPSSLRLSGNLTVEQKRQSLYTSTPPEILLLSYASLLSIKDELIHYLSSNKCMVVLDEAHKIKNTNDGVIAQSALEISEYCKARVVLTGTPAPNGYEDLYNLFKFIWPKKRIIKFSKGQLRDMTLTQNDPRVNNLIESISPFFIRIKKDDLHIPPATEHKPIIFQMSENQRKLYDLIERRFVHDMMSLNERSLFNELTKARLIRLMQVASNPKLLEDPISQFDGFDFTSEFTEDSAFFDDLKEISNESIPEKFIVAGNLISELIAKKEKVIIWCCFTKSILGLSDYLSSIGINSKILFGNTPIEKEGQKENQVEEETRESIIRDFHDKDSDFKVIIANSFAVSESISLHKACHNAIYFERTFNASHYIQSKDRIHRYGLNNDAITNYYYLVAENSIEGTIHRRLLEKEERLLEIIESMPIPLFNLIDDESSDLNEILKDYASRTKAL